jgi:hypothetical protein
LIFSIQHLENQALQTSIFLTENQVKIHSPFEKVNLENANKELKTIFEEKKTFKISDLSGHLNQTEKMQLVQFLVQNNFIYKCE